MPLPSDETRIRFLTQQQRGLDELRAIESPMAEYLRLVARQATIVCWPSFDPRPLGERGDDTDLVDA
ncbi:MAG: hypothetical protein U0575_17305 [Phycisphaerales bacterium]|jgi:hypothetical protein